MSEEKQAPKVGDVVQFSESQDKPSCTAIIVAVEDDGSADLKVLPNRPNNPAHPRAPIRVVKGSRFVDPFWRDPAQPE
jgi:hypothetical protein